MSKIFFEKEFINFAEEKSGIALDLASGKGYFSKILSELNWKVESIDIQKKYNVENFQNITFAKIDIEKITYLDFKNKLKFKKYDLILLFRFLHRPLFNLIPKFLKINGLFFCETFMIKNGIGKLNTKKYMLKENELLQLNKSNLKLMNFYQGIDTKKKHLIQSAIFQLKTKISH